MNSNAFSKLLPAKAARSFYEELRGRNGGSEAEGREGLLDEENLNHQFQDYDLEHAEALAGVDDSRASLLGGAGQAHGKRGNPRWFNVDDDPDNDVPASLLVEPHELEAATHGEQKLGGPRKPERPRQTAIPGPSTRKARSQWDTTQTQQRLHQDEAVPPPRSHVGGNAFMAGVIPGNAKKKAEWRWANVSNLDNFIKDVYDYFHGYGIWCILLERFLHLL
jgi:autophagy-related protein 9